MAGSLTVSGASSGQSGGNYTFGPSTIAGKPVGQTAISEVMTCELEANTDFVVKLPVGATSFALFFTFTGTASGEVKVRSNLNAGDAGLPVPATSAFKCDLASGTTELKLKSAQPPPAFQIAII